MPRACEARNLTHSETVTVSREDGSELCWLDGAARSSGTYAHNMTTTNNNNNMYMYNNMYM